jgi:hypothetical protein
MIRNVRWMDHGKLRHLYHLYSPNTVTPRATKETGCTWVYLGAQIKHMWRPLAADVGPRISAADTNIGKNCYTLQIHIESTLQAFTVLSRDGLRYVERKRDLLRIKSQCPGEVRHRGRIRSVHF